MFDTELAGHGLVESCGRVTLAVMRRSLDNLDGPPVPIKVSIEEDYLLDVTAGVREVILVLDQLHWATDSLTGYRNHRGSRTMNPYDYIVFGVENFLIRVVSVDDRCLRLVNRVLRIGLPERECTKNTVVNNRYVAGTRIAKALSRIDKVTAMYRKPRNEIAHSETLLVKELEMVGFYYLALARGDNSVKKYASVIRARLADYVATKQAEQRGVTTNVEDAVRGLFDVLEVEVGRVKARLV